MRARLIGLTNRVSALAGHPFTFLVVLSLVLVWAAAGPVLRFSSQWITAIQVASAIVTILMAFALQNAQNRHTTAMQLKLNELLRAVEGARERGFADMEAKDDREQAEVREALFEERRSCASLEEHRARHAPESAQQAGRSRPALGGRGLGHGTPSYARIIDVVESSSSYRARARSRCTHPHEAVLPPRLSGDRARAGAQLRCPARSAAPSGVGGRVHARRGRRMPACSGHRHHPAARGPSGCVLVHIFTSAPADSGPLASN